MDIFLSVYLGFNVFFPEKSVSLSLSLDLFQQDEMERVNGETDNDHNAGDEREWRIETEREDGGQREHTGDSSPLLFYPSPSQNVDSDSTEMEVSDSLSSDKQAISHTLTHTPELDAADFESVEGRSVVPGPERQEEEDTQKEGTLSQPTSLPTVCTHL